MNEPRWLSETEQRAWRGHMRMGWLLAAAIDRDLAVERGLSGADYMVLVALSEAEGGRVRMSELAAAILWSKSRLSHQIARMEARGLVTRQNCPSDARGTFAVLTAPGREAIEAAAPGHVESIRRHFIDSLSAEEIATLAGITERVVDRLAPIAVAPSCPSLTGDGEGAD